MKNQRAVVSTVLVLVVAAVALFAIPALSDVAVGDKAPDFKLDSLDGKTIKLSDYTNKPTLLVFWVSWCPHCQREVPVIQKVYTDLKGKGMNVVGVNVDEELDDAKTFVKDNKVTFPNAQGLSDEGRKVLDTYAVEGVPTIFIIDKTGKVTVTEVGEMSEANIRQEFANQGVK